MKALFLKFNIITAVGLSFFFITSEEGCNEKLEDHFTQEEINNHYYGPEDQINLAWYQSVNSYEFENCSNSSISEVISSRIESKNQELKELKNRVESSGNTIELKYVYLIEEANVDFIDGSSRIFYLLHSGWKIPNDQERIEISLVSCEGHIYEYDELIFQMNADGSIRPGMTFTKKEIIRMKMIQNLELNTNEDYDDYNNITNLQLEEIMF